MKARGIFVGVILGLVLLSLAWLRHRMLTLASADESAPIELADVYQPAPIPGADLDAIEADAEIKIPPNARKIYALISGFREIDTWVRLDLPAENLTSILAGTLCELPLKPVNPGSYIQENLDPAWWQPYNSTDLAECQGKNEHLQQVVLIDRTDPQLFRIYVYNWTH